MIGTCLVSVGTGCAAASSEEPSFPSQEARGEARREHYSPGAQQLLQRLRSWQKEERIALGHQDSTLYGVKWRWERDQSDVLSVCGAYPAVLGVDLGNLGQTENLDGVPFSLMRERIQEAHERGAVVTVSFHMENPVSGGDAWDTSPAVSALLPGGSHHSMLIQTLDQVAEFLSSCRTRGGESVPVLFRPYHEHNGNWFWWGTTHTKEAEYIALYRFTAEYLLKQKGQTQLLFAYSPSGSAVHAEEHYWLGYPGHDIIDVFGLDHYFSEESDQLVRLMELVTDLAEKHGKIPALTEFGLLGSLGEPTAPVSRWFSQSFAQPLLASGKARRLSYALAWRNAHEAHFFLPYPGHVAAEDFRQVCEESLLLGEVEPQ